MIAPQKIERWILCWLATLVDPDASHSLEPDSSQAIDSGTNFFEHGLDSLAIVMLSEQLSDLLGIIISVDMIFDHPTPSELAEFLSNDDNLRSFKV